MKFQSERNIFIMAVVLMVPLICSGCGRAVDKGSIVAKINNYDMTVNDFKSDLAIPSVNEKGALSADDKLEIAIKREILVQEAQKEGLDKEKTFMRTIERYWKQALYKELLNKKIKELVSDKSLTPEEINKRLKDWYQLLRKQSRVKKYNRVLEGIK